MEKIPVLLELAPVPEEGLLDGNFLTPSSKVEEIDPEKLRAGLTKLSEQLSYLLKDIKRVGEYQLTEVEVAVEISAEGGVALIGNLKAGAKGAISLKFSPPLDKQPPLFP